MNLKEKYLGLLIVTLLSVTSSSAYALDSNAPEVPYVPVGGIVPYLAEELPTAAGTPENPIQYWAWADGNAVFGTGSSVPKSLQGKHVPDLRNQFLSGASQYKSVYDFNSNGKVVPQDRQLKTSAAITFNPAAAVGQLSVKLRPRVFLPNIEPEYKPSPLTQKYKQPISFDTHQPSGLNLGHPPQATYYLHFFEIDLLNLIHAKDAFSAKIDFSPNTVRPENVPVNWIVRIQ